MDDSTQTLEVKKRNYFFIKMLLICQHSTQVNLPKDFEKILVVMATSKTAAADTKGGVFRYWDIEGWSFCILSGVLFCVGLLHYQREYRAYVMLSACISCPTHCKATDICTQSALYTDGPIVVFLIWQRLDAFYNYILC